MNGSFSVWADVFGLRRRETDNVLPRSGEVFAGRLATGPVEYAQVIDVYEEAKQIHHVRFRLIYGYQDKTEILGERTLAADRFLKRFTERVETAENAVGG